MSEPEFRSFLRSIIEVLADLKLAYAIGGSVASSAYGEARSTQDVDISVMLPLDRVSSFVQAFRALDYYVFLDAVLDAIIGRHMFNIIDARSGYKADIFPVDPDTPTFQERQVFQRCRPGIYDVSSGAEAVLYSPEDVIIYKLKYYLEGRMPKHLRDIGAMLAVQGDALEYVYVAEWAERIGAGEIWAAILAEYRRSL